MKSKLKIGITGGIGCGKSTATKTLETLGAKVIDCDLIAKCKTGEVNIYKQIVEALSPEIFEAGILNKQEYESHLANHMILLFDNKLLSNFIFENPDKRRALEKILHPEIISEYRKQVEHKEGIIVVEAPLLFECNLTDDFDFTVCISSTNEVQMKRLRTRGLNDMEIRSRKSAQMALEMKEELADFTIPNNASPEEFSNNVIRAYTTMLQRHFIVKDFSDAN